MRTDQLIEAATTGRTGRLYGAKALTGIMAANLAGLAAAELFCYYVNSVSGLVVHILVLFSLIGLAAAARDSSQRNALVALGLAPLLRIISLTLPVILQLSQYIWYVIIAIPIMVAVISLARYFKFSTEDIGLIPDKPGVQLIAALGGVSLGVLGYCVMRTPAWTTSFSPQTTLFPALVLLVFTGFVEEIVFRGVIQKAISGLGRYWWLYPAAIYAVLQIGQGNPTVCIFALAASVYFGYVVEFTRSIVGVSLAHGLINIAVFLVLPHVLHF